MSLRVTIGSRLGLFPRGTKPPANRTLQMPEVSSDGVPLEIEPEKVIRLADLPSAETMPIVSAGWWCQFCQEQHFSECEAGPRRVRGEMVWLHKTAPTLVIEGGPGLSPEEHAAGRRR